MAYRTKVFLALDYSLFYFPYDLCFLNSLIVNQRGMSNMNESQFFIGGLYTTHSIGQTCQESSGLLTVISFDSSHWKRDRFSGGTQMRHITAFALVR